MTIGERIKFLRKNNNLTQEKLAEHLGVSYQAISKWECGLSNPDLYLIAPIARLFNISTDELLGVTENDDTKARSSFNSALHRYRNDKDISNSYRWAKEAVWAYPKDYNYLEWLAYSEYQLAFYENKAEHPSFEYFNELIESALRHYEIIVENCAESNVYSNAVLGKIMVLSFLNRTAEADWSAEFEYPDINIKTAKQAMALCEDGQALLSYLKNESEQC